MTNKTFTTDRFTAFLILICLFIMGMFSGIFMKKIRGEEKPVSVTDSAQIIAKYKWEIEEWKADFFELRESAKAKQKVIVDIRHHRDTIRPTFGYTRYADSLIILNLTDENFGLWELHDIDSATIAGQLIAMGKQDSIIDIQGNLLAYSYSEISKKDTAISQGKTDLVRMKKSRNRWRTFGILDILKDVALVKLLL